MKLNKLKTLITSTLPQRIYATKTIIALAILFTIKPAIAIELQPAPAPPNNPLKGLVPYTDASKRSQFPHSMEFCYFPLNDIMKGPNKFDWKPIDKALAEVSKRGNQIIFRIYSEYPGRKIALPQFLIDNGVKITKWKNKEDNQISHTPDYENPKLRTALTKFITALGAKYDGDPRIGFITVGILGSWGEWHTYPREDLWASKPVQKEILEAYTKAFSKTKLLLRYPANSKSDTYTENSSLPFGYHDDSFSWATTDSGKKSESWFFEPTMKAAKATQKWKKYPIGGEIRPELWKKSFTSNPHPRDQGFVKCVERLHVTWLMDTGLFDTRFKIDNKRKNTALKQVAKMGYQLYISKAEWNNGTLTLTIHNQGVAPFYYNWPIEAQLDGKTTNTNWKLTQILPGKPQQWTIKMKETSELKIRIPNPMKGGKPLHFANKDQGPEWLKITL